MTTPAGDGKTPHRARNLFDGIDLASNTMKVCLGSITEVSRGHENVRCWGKSGSRFAVWKRVVKAVEKLLSKERPDGATVQ